MSPEEAVVIDSPFFQRLRNIRQLGFGDFAFPGATHTRHAHSLGAMHVASKLFNAVATRSSLPTKTRARFGAAVRLAMLCHDLGHMPLSHSSENIAPHKVRLCLPEWMGQGQGHGLATHEDFTARILLDSSLTPLIAQAYDKWDLSPVQIVSLITGKGETSFLAAGIDWMPLLRAIVSGELDADRMDYLLRDSFYTGVNYGRYDIEWILENVLAAERNGSAVLALSKAAIFAFEDFLLSRHHMFLSVYLHHTSIAFNWMLRRYYEECPGEFEIPADPEAFLECDDMALQLTMRNSKNPWAIRIANRQSFRRAAEFTELDEEYDLNTLAHALTEAGVEHFAVESHSALSKYLEEGELPSLYIVDQSSGRLTEISNYTALYQRFDRPVRLSRVYVRPDQIAIAKPVIAALTSGTDYKGEK